MKTDSISWQRHHKICNGIKDFGLLREKQIFASDETTRKKISVYISRTVLIIGVVAAITFVICLVLADRYQKSVTLKHHYASFIHEKGRGKYHQVSNHTYSDGNYRDTLQKGFNESLFNKIQNFSNELPSIQEINFLLPVTTVLRSLNTSRNDKQLKFNNFLTKGDSNNFSQFQHRKGTTMAEVTARGKSLSSLADLLKRTESKLSPAHRNTTLITSDTDGATVTKSTVHFAQLEPYEHPRNTKNLQGVMKYLRCNLASSCDFKYESSVEDTSENAEMINSIVQAKKKNVQEDRNQKQNATTIRGIFSDKKSNFSPSSWRVPQNKDDMLYLDINSTPSYHSLSFIANHKDQILALDPFYNYRAFSPLDINHLESDGTISTSTAASERTVHRFSNRMYHNSEENIAGTPVNENIDALRTQFLDAFLKPPTISPPTTLSFTPSHTNALIHEFDQLSIPNHDSRSEVTAIDTMTQMKPITLMVEIFPANDYELPASLFRDDSYTTQFTKQKQSFSYSNQVNNPFFTSWRVPPSSQNKMKLLVNLFPQLQHRVNPMK